MAYVKNSSRGAFPLHNNKERKKEEENCGQKSNFLFPAQFVHKDPISVYIAIYPEQRDQHTQLFVN